jgi:hypothetical protein
MRVLLVGMKALLLRMLVLLVGMVVLLLRMVVLLVDMVVLSGRMLALLLRMLALLLRMLVASPAASNGQERKMHHTQQAPLGETRQTVRKGVHWACLLSPSPPLIEAVQS